MRCNILCVVEFDRYPNTVVERAVWLASTHDCDLHLLICDPVTDFLGESYVYLLESQDIANSIRASQREVVEELSDIVDRAGVKVSVDWSSERHATEVIRKEVAARQPMFVVKGTHYHTPSERASLDSVDWDLIRDLDQPLWLVKPASWKESPVIVAAVDPVHAHDKPAILDQRIIGMARAVADESGGTLKVLHTYQRLGELGHLATWAFKPAKLPVEELDKKIRSEHKKALANLAETSKISDKLVHLLPGRAHEVLPAFAREVGASLVVMGALARSKLKQRIIGSTATRALDHIHCDVLIAHGKRD